MTETVHREECVIEPSRLCWEGFSIWSSMLNTITDIPGITVGHYTDREAATGCTVVLCEKGAVAGVDVRGSAPGTRETDLLRPCNLIEKIHGIVLSGGSAFGCYPEPSGGAHR